MVIGIKIYVDWIESTAIDLLLLNWLQYYKDMRKFWDNFRGTYRNLARANGLRVSHR